MAAVVHHALLALNVGVLGAAGWRAAAGAVPGGLERGVAAAVLAGAVAVAEAVLLGLAGLGTSPAALTLASLVVLVLAWRLVPSSAGGAGLGGWWRGLGLGARAALGAVTGAGLAWAAWQLRYPALGFDTVHYHLPESVIWVQKGTPGSVEPVLPGLPVGNYPVTHEVLVAWTMGLARSFVPVTLLTWALLALTAVSGWLGLRRLSVRPAVAALAVAALCALPPLLAWQEIGGITDPPALAWLTACAALALSARERPRLLAVALLAAALAVGTKTTVLPFAGLVLALAGWRLRGHARALRGPLALALVLGLVVGGGWYARNLVDHGSPFWPIVAAPWGDPVPPSVAAVQTSFLERPGATVDALGDRYLDRFGGGLLLIAGGLLAPLLVRRRATIAAGAATALGLLVWARAPVTGLSRVPGLDETTFSTVRYLLPVLAAACLALALAAGRPGRRVPAAIAAALLATALVVNLAQVFGRGFPVSPSPVTPLAGGVLGALAALAVSALPARPPLRRPRVRLAVAAGAVVVAGVVLALPAGGYVARHADTGGVLSSGASGWLADRPGYAAGSRPVAGAGSLIGVAAGDRLRHPLVPVPPGESCERLAARTRAGWLVVFGAPVSGARPVNAGRCRGIGPPAYEGGAFAVFGPRR